MTDLTVQRGAMTADQLVRRPAFLEPTLSPALEAAIAAYDPSEMREGIEGAMYEVPRPRPVITDDLLAEARSVLPIYQTAVDTYAEPVHLAAWLVLINGVVSNPRPPKDLAAFAAALLAVDDEVPLAALNSHTQYLAVRRWKHFPSGAEVLDLLDPFREQWTRIKAGIQMVIVEAERRAYLAANG